MVTMLAGMQTIEPDYDSALCELVYSTDDERSLGAALRGWTPPESVPLEPAAAVWLGSVAGAAGILPFVLRGVMEMTELKVTEVRGRSLMGACVGVLGRGGGGGSSEGGISRCEVWRRMRAVST
jgi:hypothetical protein